MAAFIKTGRSVLLGVTGPEKWIELKFQADRIKNGWLTAKQIQMLGKNKENGTCSA